MTRSFITTHVLDTAAGQPAAGIAVVLLHRNPHDDAGWQPLASGQTDADGRVTDLGPESLPSGTYQLTFSTESYFTQRGQEAFFPEVSLTFAVDAAQEHYHVPLLLSHFAYSTYRGS